ncbi:MAG: hypothetical protein HZB55_10170 [Deltaproteobacteria bacterium]|nr:hypothetical protein [Deltaproteobacteria bacterium]
MGPRIRTDAEKAVIKASFAARRRRQFLVLTPLLGIVIAVAGLADARSQAVLGVPAGVWAPALFAGLGGAAVYTLFNWRCPACNRYLGAQWSPMRCRGCGIPLR